IQRGAGRIARSSSCCPSAHSPSGRTSRHFGIPFTQPFALPAVGGAVPLDRAGRPRPARAPAPHDFAGDLGLSQADTPLSRHLAPAGSLFQTGLFFPSYRQFLSAHLSSGLAMHWLAFPAAVVLYRISISRTAACDVAFGFMLAAAAILSLFPHMPEPLHRIDMFYLARGGAAGLRVQSAPRRYAGSLLVCAGLLLSIHGCL